MKFKLILKHFNENKGDYYNIYYRTGSAYLYACGISLYAAVQDLLFQLDSDNGLEV
jgi:hypothetical protein